MSYSCNPLDATSQAECTREAANHGKDNWNNKAVSEEIPWNGKAQVPEWENPNTNREYDGVQNEFPRAQQVIQWEQLPDILNFWDGSLNVWVALRELKLILQVHHKSVIEQLGFRLVLLK